MSNLVQRELKSFCVLNDFKLSDVAAHVGVSSTLLSLWMSGRRCIEMTAAFAIQEYTQGTVNIEDWPWLINRADGTGWKHEGAGREPDTRPRKRPKPGPDLS